MVQDITAWASKGDGAFKRNPSSFREQITRSGGKYPAEKGRYHLIVSLAWYVAFWQGHSRLTACGSPWAHRTLSPWRDRCGLSG
jgi:glutathionyl-hydroquinone reductase